ncbi:unnamed protein product [Plutella xylostella]|uniref:(diamondback moth) hypothetical protein n=1 Tax=Plutella xylostella TaxID=51655 RepID=A0A8S4G5T0_PLUXY|nr:unnamed protein product [Plutella xylostella]CAG9135172.1 unnamed protein product [Plutella xylostella]CAG9135173.1 unnamed protein product [Plutella xylostella]CAG9135174.1 unnamed protein product [Plutella xylostella]CAG9135176.1 unnamed protein product [Plutella xylostella]
MSAAVKLGHERERAHAERNKYCAAVKLGHERERAHAERNKYWYIVASIAGDHTKPSTN